jgi:toxin HigB-1
MIIDFADQGTKDIFNGNTSSRARKKCPQQVWSVAQRKLDQLDSSTELRDLAIPPGNRLEALSGYRQGQHSIRINDQYRICFIWTKSGPLEVEITDYH